LLGCTEGACTQFQACPAGWIGHETPKDSCLACLPGETSFSGAITCLNCAKGKFSIVEGSSECEKCLIGMFQSQDQTVSITCQDCPLGWTNNATGESSCQSLGYKTSKDCSDVEFLNDTVSDPQNFKCEECPNGESYIFLNFFQFYFLLFFGGNEIFSLLFFFFLVSNRCVMCWSSQMVRSSSKIWLGTMFKSSAKFYYVCRSCLFGMLKSY